MRREQYRQADNQETSADIARAIVAAKIISSRALLNRALRDGAPEPEILKSASARLAQLLGDLKRAGQLDSVRGVEGMAARVYFQAFDHLILHQKDDFRFQGRNRRPPLDNINALLSFCYTLLLHDVTSALESVGLDPAVGYLHRDRPGRPGLALDLMEEFRAFLADRLALSLINQKQIKGRGFTRGESGGVHMDEVTRKEVMVAYQKRKQDEITHPFLGEKTTVGLLFHLQALLMARFLRGDLDGYPPFATR